MASASAAIEQRNQDATLYVGGLDERCDEDLLYELFVQAGPVASVFLPTDKVSGRHQNFAFVEFRTEDDAEYAMNVLNMVRLFGKSLRVSKAGGGPGAAGGAPPRRDVGANLFVGNLAPEVDEKMLFDTFSAFGGIVTQPKVMRDEAGTSKGFGFVSFDSFESSDSAIEAMTGQHFAGRPVVVQYAFRKDSKTERHGSQAERLLAAASRSKAPARPHTLFAAAPGQVLSSVPQAAMIGSVQLQAQLLHEQQQAQQAMLQQFPAGVDQSGAWQGDPATWHQLQQQQLQQMQMQQQVQMQMQMQQRPLPPPLPPMMPSPLPPLPETGVGVSASSELQLMQGGRRDNRPAWMLSMSGLPPVPPSLP